MSRAREKLTEFEIRPTRQRLELAGLLFEAGDPMHFTADGLYERSQRAGLKISQATVYNCLHLFCEAGLIREIAIEGHKSFYDTRTDGHPHFYHVSTGELVDAPADIVYVELKGEVPAGKHVSGIDIVIRLDEDQVAH